MTDVPPAPPFQRRLSTPRTVYNNQPTYEGAYTNAVDGDVDSEAYLSRTRQAGRLRYATAIA